MNESSLYLIIVQEIFQHLKLHILMISISQYFNLGTSQYQITFYSPPLPDFLLRFPLCFSRVLITSAGVQGVVVLPKRNAEGVCCEQSWDYFGENRKYNGHFIKAEWGHLITITMRTIAEKHYQ